MISRNHFARTFLVVWHIYGILIMSWLLRSSRFVCRLYRCYQSYIIPYVYFCTYPLYLSFSCTNILCKKGTFSRIDIFINQFAKIGRKKLKRIVSRYCEMERFDGNWRKFFIINEFLKIFLVNNDILKKFLAILFSTNF